jgi:hypothetical protein
MRRRPLLSLAALVALAPMVASCLSPTLPLPPPDQPENISQSSAGLWQVAGTCDAGAFVYVFNTSTGRGVFVEDKTGKGLYQVSLPGTQCDVAWVTQQVGDNESTETFFVLEPFTNGSVVDPTTCP